MAIQNNPRNQNIQYRFTISNADIHNLTYDSKRRNVTIDITSSVQGVSHDNNYNRIYGIDVTRHDNVIFNNPNHNDLYNAQTRQNLQDSIRMGITNSLLHLENSILNNNQTFIQNHLESNGINDTSLTDISKVINHQLNQNIASSLQNIIEGRNARPRIIVPFEVNPQEGNT